LPGAHEGEALPPASSAPGGAGGAGSPGSRTAAAVDDRARNLRTVARGGTLNLVGAVTNGILGFALVVVLTRGLSKQQLGAFFVSIALFQILSNTAELGADTGLVRIIARYRALGRKRDLRRTIAVGLWPVFGIAVAFGAVVWAFAPALSNVFARQAPPRLLVPYLRVLGPLLPASAAFTVVLAASRGFGSMRPTVVLDKFVRAGLQVGLELAVVLLGLGATAVALAWGGPFAVGLALAIVWMVALLRRAERGEALEEPSSTAALASEFWRFTAPRSLAGFFQVGILWLDTLLIGALRSAASAGGYGAATRYITVGTFANLAVIQVLGPKLSELLARHDRAGAQHVYQVATSWLMMLVWPYYVTLAVFAPALLGILHNDSAATQAVLVILGLTMLVATGIGPVDVVLLMGGRSAYNLANTIAALTANVVLNLVLIPRLGIAGAAIAWSVSILINNLAPLAQVWALLRIHPFGIGSPIVALAAVGVFGGVGVVVRIALGATLPALLLAGAVSTALYAAIVWRFRSELELRSFTLRRRPKRTDAPPLAAS
jgi:O-antigen/teichoic acid export membrane protein